MLINEIADTGLSFFSVLLRLFHELVYRPLHLAGLEKRLDVYRFKDLLEL